MQLADVGKGWKLMLPDEESTAIALFPVKLAEYQPWQGQVNQFIGLVSDYTAALGPCLKEASKYREAGLTLECLPFLKLNSKRR